jgi:hypothetical protein
LAAIVLIAAGGAVAYAVEFHPSDHHPSPLPTRQVSNSDVGLVGLSATSSHFGAPLVQMTAAGPVPHFAPLAFAIANSPKVGPWTADLMAGGGYIFIYLSDGRCLAAGSHARLVMQHCDIHAAAQRWRRVSGALVRDGHSFYQYANVADGRCMSQASTLTGRQEPAVLATCKPGQPPDQMVAFWWSTQ